MKAFLLSLVTLVVLAPQSHACDCTPPGPIEGELASHELVITGKITAQENNHSVVTVDEGFKGAKKGDTYKIFHDPNRMCNLDLVKGTSYLLFLEKDEHFSETPGGYWEAELCTLSQELARAKKKVAKLRTLAKKK